MGGRKWDEAQARFRNVAIFTAIALLIFAYNFLMAVSCATSSRSTRRGGARSLLIAGIHTHVLNVVCLLASVAEVFDHFVVSVIERLSAIDESAVRAVETVLQRWRQCLIAPSRPARARPAGRNPQRAARRLRCCARQWGSPDRVLGRSVRRPSRHALRQYAVEVKTARSHTGHRVTIHGEDQLLASEQGFPYDLEYVCGRTTSAAARRKELLVNAHSSTYSTVT